MASTNNLSNIVKARAAAASISQQRPANSQILNYKPTVQDLNLQSAVKKAESTANVTAKKNLNNLIRSTAKAPVKNVKQEVSGETKQKMVSPILPKAKDMQAMAKFKATTANSKVNVLNRTIPINFKATDIKAAAAAAVAKRRQTFAQNYLAANRR